MPEYVVSTTDKPDAGEVIRLFKQTSWARHRDEQRVGRMLAGLQVFVAVRAEGRLVAFGRALTDGLFRALVDDVVVDEAHRGRGLGRRVVSGLVEQLEHVDEAILLAEHNLEPFYAPFGFAKFEGLTMLKKA